VARKRDFAWLARSASSRADGGRDVGVAARVKRRQTDARGEFRAVRFAGEQVDEPGAHFPVGRVLEEGSDVGAVPQPEPLRHQHLDRPADQLLVGVAEYGRRGDIGEDDPPLNVHEDERIGRESQQMLRKAGEVVHSGDVQSTGRAQDTVETADMHGQAMRQTCSGIAGLPRPFVVHNTLKAGFERS
jgi:hypothetical protein